MKEIAVEAYALFSGGKDSMTLAHVLASKGMLKACVAFDTGISVPDWRPFIEGVCAEQGWPLIFLQAPISYEDLVQKYGFPGPGMHNVYMNFLKGRCVRDFQKTARGTLLASGVRLGESKRRFRGVRQWGLIEKMPIWAPLYDWTTEETWNYMHTHGLTRAPAYTTLGISGDCLCGAFAQPHEREVIEEMYPDLHQRLVALESLVGGRWGCGKARRGSQSNEERVICAECDPSGRPGSGTR